MKNIPSEEELRKKATRKARPGGAVKWRNLPRNWVHQAISYMDAGELLSRLIVETAELVLVWCALVYLFPEMQLLFVALLAFVFVHTWNWVTNGLFWSVIIFTFPSLRNPGATATVRYLNQMRGRLLGNQCISGVMIYGSVTRGSWHDRSDIDIRFLRRPGIGALCCATWVTMRERFRAFLEKQPMDLYLADDVDFLKKMRADEMPVIMLCRDERLEKLYSDCQGRPVQLSDLLRAPNSCEDSPH